MVHYNLQSLCGLLIWERYLTWPKSTGYRGRDKHRPEPYEEWPPGELLLARGLGMYHRVGLFGT
jgi:hypothetical protein